MLWGSPHSCASDHSEDSCWGDGDQHLEHPKNAAFESMCKLCQGIVIMTFSNHYECSLRQLSSQYNYPARQLIVGPTTMHQYRPMRSSSVSISAISESDEVLVAMAIPLPCVKCIEWSDGKIVFNVTLRRMLAAIKQDNQYGVALGVYAANLEVDCGMLLFLVECFY